MYDNIGLSEKEIAKLMNSSFGEALKNLRYNENMTMVDLAEQSKISQPYISQIENNVRVPSDKIIKSLANALAYSKNDTYDEYGNYSNSINNFSPLDIEKRFDEYFSLLKSLKLNTQKKEVIPLDQFMKDFDINKPLSEGEFITKYINQDGNELIFGGIPLDKHGIFDLNGIIQNSFSLNTTDENNFMSIGKSTPLYYCGKKLEHKDRIKIMKILDVVFDIDREKYNKQINLDI
ncbi:helix-turn-helix domain-containing protein [Enterococcus sp. FR169]|uniref:helix-turn-helix domain-containing protein n=1 Tax=Enterococcus sp. FR169 TaxID=2923505 RepID=UPI00280CEF14|nr:helix-turn-helix domain-containing protein [Enterococcus sp. FR169]MDQ8644378.1 helix-turn-helix domain-containing protein [Enterococcus sp. FR169]